MTAPKKKSPSKPKTAAKAAPKKKLTSNTKTGENVVKSPSDEVVEKEVKKAKAPKFLSKKVSEFVVGTKEYGEVVADFNKIFKRQYNTNRVPPYIFKTMLDRLRKHYNVNE